MQYSARSLTAPSRGGSLYGYLPTLCSWFPSSWLLIPRHWGVALSHALATGMSENTTLAVSQQKPECDYVVRWGPFCGIFTPNSWPCSGASPVTWVLKQTQGELSRAEQRPGTPAAPNPDANHVLLCIQSSGAHLLETRKRRSIH